MNQFIYKRIKLLFLFQILLIHLLIYYLYYLVSPNINIHLHHSFISGILSLCFTDFNLRFSRYMHAIMIGIIIQGLNFYSVKEFFIFKISTFINEPNNSYSLVLYSIFLLFCFIIYILNKYWCKNKKDEDDDDEIDNLEMQLIPNIY